MEPALKRCRNFFIFRAFNGKFDGIWCHGHLKLDHIYQDLTSIGSLKIILSEAFKFILKIIQLR